MKTFSFLAVFVFTLLPLARADHRDNDHRASRGRVVLFQHANFQGGALVLEPGDSVDNFSGRTFDNGAKLNDGVSSILIEGRAEIVVYDNAQFRGESLRLTESASDLTRRYVAGGVNVTWNDRISSVKVGGDRGGGRDPDRRPPFRGDPDKLVRDVFKDLLGREPNPGEFREFRGRIVDSGWDEGMLRDELRSDRNYRVEMATFIVSRAYREVLGREVDPSGMNAYRKRILERKWTDSDVRDDLRKSAEYRNKHR